MFLKKHTGYGNGVMAKQPGTLGKHIQGRIVPTQLSHPQ